jgi:hypothetical protein
MTKNLKKFTAEKGLNFWGSELQLPIARLLKTKKDIKVTEEAFSSRK